MEKFSTSAGGASYGFLADIFGIGGAVRGMFLSAFGLPKAVYIAPSGAIALVIDTTWISTYVTGGTRLEPSYDVRPFDLSPGIAGRIANRQKGRRTSSSGQVQNFHSCIHFSGRVGSGYFSLSILFDRRAQPEEIFQIADDSQRSLDVESPPSRQFCIESA